MRVVVHSAAIQDRDGAAERRREGLRRAAAPLGGRVHLFLVRVQPAACQGFREPRRNPRRLRHPRFDPARPQAACPGVGADLNNEGRDDGASPAAGGERLLSDQSADPAARTAVTALRRNQTERTAQRSISRKPCFAEAVDQVCTIVGTEFEQLVDRKSHQDAKCFAELRQRIVHHRVRLIHVAHLAKSSD
jgi:hypothetical protein